MTPDDRQRRREGSRRARSARERRAEAQQRNRSKTGVYIAAALLVIVAVAAALFLLLRGGGTELGHAVPLLPAEHRPPYVWIQEVEGAPGRVPPTSGHHFDLPHQGWGFTGETLVPERVIHNMEHGGVVIWYQPDDPELAGNVNQLVRTTGNQCVVAGSYSDMTYEVAATVWGRVLPLESFESDPIIEFVDLYRGSQGPEAGLCYRESY